MQGETQIKCNKVWLQSTELPWQSHCSWKAQAATSMKRQSSKQQPKAKTCKPDLGSASVLPSQEWCEGKAGGWGVRPRGSLSVILSSWHAGGPLPLCLSLVIRKGLTEIGGSLKNTSPYLKHFWRSKPLSPSKDLFEAHEWACSHLLWNHTFRQHFLCPLASHNTINNPRIMEGTERNGTFISSRRAKGDKINQ